MEQVLGGLQILMTWQNFLVIPIGLIIGIVVGVAFGVHQPEPLICGYVVATLFAMISITPQGVGVVEAAVVVAFTSFGVSGAAGLSIALVYRGIVFWMPFLIGAILIQTTKTFKHDAKRAVRDQKGKGLRR